MISGNDADFTIDIFDNVMLLGKKATSGDIKHQPVASEETVLHGLRNSSISPEQRPP